jgi:hypothetical protein
MLGFDLEKENIVCILAEQAFENIDHSPVAVRGCFGVIGARILKGFFEELICGDVLSIKTVLASGGFDFGILKGELRNFL